MKYAFIRLRDGYDSVGTGAVNNAAGYAIGATTMLVNTITGAVAVGDRFNVVGSDDDHVITAHTETTGNTTSITFTPGLEGAVLDDAVITFLPHQIEVKIGEGNLTYDETRKYKYTLDRGRLDTIKQDDEEPLSVKFDMTWEWIKGVTNSGIPTIEDALKKRGEAADWVSSSDDPCEPYCIDIEVEYVPPCAGEGTEVILFEEFRWESLGHDLRAGTISCSGKCNKTDATVDRIAAA